MAFSSFSQAAASANGGTGPTARDGPDLQEIQTNELGFPGVNGEVKLQLSDAWPQDNLPPTTSSLLAVASRTGLVAAAGPNELILTSTAQIRHVLLEPFDKEKDKSPIRPYEPNLRIPRPRLAHVAFTADDSGLVVSAQDGGGVDAYSVKDLEKATPAVSISTEGKALRALVPNPAAEADLAPLLALVTVDGELLMADLKSGNMRSGSNGPVLRTGVSCVAWSNKGKALIAGLADGTAVQIKPDGSEMAMIPKTTALEQGFYVAAISWLQNDTFLFVYTSSTTEFPPPPSEFYIIDRQPKSTDYTFKKLPEAVALFGMERIPSHYFLTRLRNFPPSLPDLIVVAATGSSDVGLITKADKALSKEAAVIDNFSTTLIADDGRRAALPLSSGDETSPIGMAIDLSSDHMVRDPIPTDIDIEETPHPVPQLLILNNQGWLCSWWVIYNDSVRQKTPYPGIGEASDSKQESSMSMEQTAAQPPQPPVQSSGGFAAATSTFGQSAFGANAAKPATPAFGAASSFGGSSGGTFGSGESSFGKPSTIGGAKPSWTSTGFGNATPSQTTSGFGQPSFGSASAIGAKAPAFGSASALGKPAFGQPSTAPTFGSPGFGSKPGGSGTSGFASFSSGGGFGAGSNKETEKPASSFGQPSSGGFGSFGAAKNSGTSAFGQTSNESPFAKSSQSPFGGLGTTNAQPSASSFGQAGGFKLQSSFKGDPSAKEDGPKPANPGSGFGFGGSFDDMLGQPQKVTSPTHNKEESMSEGGLSEEETSTRPFSGFSAEAVKSTSKPLITPPSTIGQPKATPAPPVSNLFGKPSEQSTTPQPPPPSSTGWNFGNAPAATPKENAPAQASTTPKDTPGPQPSLFGRTQEPAPVPFGLSKTKSDSRPKIKEESASEDEAVDLSNVPEAPLPPDPVSKPGYVAGDSSASSSNSRSIQQPEDGPTERGWKPANTSADGTQPGLPSEEDDDFSESEFDESGEAEDDASTPGEERADTHAEEEVQTSPESSFRSGERSTANSPTGGLFTKVTTTTQNPRPLFGEVGATGPIFAPPKPQESPRSPSPVRHLLTTDRLNSEASRSVSAPAYPRSVIDQRKQAYAQSGLAAQAHQAQQQEWERQKQQQEQALRQKEDAEALELQDLEDDDDEALQQELDAPINATEVLAEFVTYQAHSPEQGIKSGVPAQIERLYRDINSMVYTLGINSRSLASYMKYQREQEPSESWPATLESDTPADALNDEWFLGDIDRLRDGQSVLEDVVQSAQVTDVDDKLEVCQQLLSQDLNDMKMKLASVRKTLNAASRPEEAQTAPLSAEQALLQQDLRKAAVSVQSKLVQVEDALAVLRAKVAESAPAESTKRKTIFGGATVKKPTIEAVTNTVMKMTKMAEQKSADVDVLEAQMRKLNVARSMHGSRQVTPNDTPDHRRAGLSTPGSSGSVYHTPGSKFGGSTKSTPGWFRDNGKASAISIEDRENWQAKAQRKKAVAAMLKAVLHQRKQTVTQA